MNQIVKNHSNSYKRSIMDSPISILLVEDNMGDVIIIKELLIASGIEFSLDQVSTLKDTLPLCTEKKYDVILLDLGLPDSIGMETLKKIQVFNFKSPVVVMTGLDDEDTALESLRVGALDYLVKNRLTPENVFRSIKYSIERKKIQDLCKKNASQFSLLSSTTATINESDEISSIYSVACFSISKLVEQSGVLAIELTDPPGFYYNGTDCLEHGLIRIKKYLEFSLNTNDGNDAENEIRELFKDGRLQKSDTELYSNLVPNAGSEEEILSPSCWNIYNMGFVRANILFGGILIFASEPVSADEISIIETIGNQVSLSLHRKVFENDLKASKDKYQLLSQELEVKVRERTRELEISNYNLNQELVERHVAEESLKKSESRLRELNATKDKFFNIIAHDLKNPFTSLLGSSELLNENIDNMDLEGIKVLTQIISDSSKSGYAILQNLLDWSRSQTGLITFNPERLNLRNLIDENISDFKASASQKGINLYSLLTDDMYIFADMNMINTVLRNLISNAIKFTYKDGTVNIDAMVTSSEIIISVKDSGIGMSEDIISKLFRIDLKITRPGTNKEQGTGLGLKLCKEFLDLQGGRIWVESELNKGSEFIFSIPLKQKV